MRTAMFIPLILMSPAIAAGPIERAVAYLGSEVPKWAAENKCYSCHNNGDGARALYLAVRRGIAVDSKSIADTTRFLSRPGEWDGNGQSAAFGDKKLARIQYASALLGAIEAGVVSDKAVLRKAADSLLPFQEKDGSWKSAAEGPGSPTNYGTALATYMAWRVVDKTDSGDRAKAWLLALKPTNNIERAVLLMMPGVDQIRKSLVTKELLTAQTSEGGWGPQPGSRRRCSIPR